MPEAPTEILLVRHGQSEWNALARWQGQADIPLTAEGRGQASEAARHLPRFGAVASSDLVRAAETAERLAAPQGLGAVHLDPRLREAHAGEWQGLTPEEIEAGWPGFLAEGRRPPSFEVAESVAARAHAAVLDLAAAHPGDRVLAVSHSGTIRALRNRCGGPDVRLPNLAGVWFSVHAGEIEAGAEIHLLAYETRPATD